MLEGNEQRLDDGKSHYSVATKHYMSLYEACVCYVHFVPIKDQCF